jgi:hypothetical protein
MKWLLARPESAGQFAIMIDQPSAMRGVRELPPSLEGNLQWMTIVDNVLDTTSLLPSYPFSKSTNVGKSVTNFVMHGTVYALRRSSPLQPGAQPECVLFPQHVQVPALSCLKQCGSVHCCTSQKTL